MNENHINILSEYFKIKKEEKENNVFLEINK